MEKPEAFLYRGNTGNAGYGFEQMVGGQFYDGPEVVRLDGLNGAKNNMVKQEIDGDTYHIEPN